MQIVALLPIALAAVAFAQSDSGSAITTSAPYSNANTVYLTQTDSNGVVTGQPSVITSQPAAATSQDAAAIVPAGFSGTTTIALGNATLVTVAVNSGVVSTIRSTPSPTTQTASGSGGSASGSSASASSSSGAGNHVKAGIGALAAAGGFFAIFL